MQIGKLVIHRYCSGAVSLSYKFTDRGYYAEPGEVVIEKSDLDAVIKELQKMKDYIEVEQDDPDECID